MNFMELQNRIERYRKLRKNGKLGEWEGPNEFDIAVYHEALRAANNVVKHYFELGEYNSKDKPDLTWK